MYVLCNVMYLYYNVQLDMYSCTVLDYYLSVFLTIFISKNSDYTMENIMYLVVSLEGTDFISILPYTEIMCQKVGNKNLFLV